MVSSHRKYTLNQISRKGDDDVDKYMSYKSLFNIHTSMHEFEAKEDPRGGGALSVVPPKHALIIGIASSPTDDNEWQRAATPLYLHKPFRMVCNYCMRFLCC